MMSCDLILLRHKVRRIQRQQLQDLRFKGDRSHHLGVNDVHIIQLSVVKFLQNLLGDVPCTVHGGILRGIHELRIDIQLAGTCLALEVHASDLPHHVQTVVLTCADLLLCQLDDIVVIGTEHALVRRDDQIAHLAFLFGDVLPAVEVVHVDVLRRTGKDTAHCIYQFVEIWFGCRQILLRLLQFGGGDQIHGVGDLHNIVNALNPIPNFMHIRHISSPAFCNHVPMSAAVPDSPATACPFPEFPER